MKQILSLLKKILPWLITLLIFVWLFYQHDPRKVWSAFMQVQPVSFSLYAIGYFIFAMMMDSYSLSWVLNKFCARVSFREVLPARGASYLLAIVNYNAGQAGLAYYFKHTKEASFFRVLGSLLLILIIDLYWVSLFAFVGSFFNIVYLGPFHLSAFGHHFYTLPRFDLSHWISRLVPILFLALLAHLIFWRQWFSKLFKVHVRIRFFDWVRGKHLFQAFHEASVPDYLKIALLRLPIHITVICTMYFVITTFHAHIPFFTVLTAIPEILLIGAIPITPGGLGTVQAATIEILKPHITVPVLTKPEDILLALSMAWMVANYLLKAIIGAICLRQVSTENFKKGRF